MIKECNRENRFSLFFIVLKFMYFYIAANVLNSLI